MTDIRENRVGSSPDQSANTGMPASAAASSVMGAVQETAATVGNKAHEMIAEVGQRVHDAASTVAHSARDAASTVGNKTDGAISSVGQGISSLAGSVREKVSHEGTLGSAASAVADQLDAAGSYLQQHGLEDMGKDLTAVVRKYPIPAVLAALGIGLLLGRTRK